MVTHHSNSVAFTMGLGLIFSSRSWNFGFGVDHIGNPLSDEKFNHVISELIQYEPNINLSVGYHTNSANNNWKASAIGVFVTYANFGETDRNSELILPFYWETYSVVALSSRIDFKSIHVGLGIHVNDLEDFQYRTINTFGGVDVIKNKLNLSLGVEVDVYRAQETESNIGMLNGHNMELQLKYSL